MMKQILVLVLLMPITTVVGLAKQRLVIKPRSVTSLETDSQFKSTLFLPRAKQPKHHPPSPSLASDEIPSQKKPAWMYSERNYDDRYWYHPQIHTLGNIGIFGALHAALAPLSTHIIDTVAYNGVDIRLKVAQELRELVGKSQARVLDMCCGVGMSTRALGQGFPDAKDIVGLDTSTHMVAMANFLTTHLIHVVPVFQEVKTRLEMIFALLREQKARFQCSKKSAVEKFLSGGIQYFKANAENTDLPDQSFDVVTVMYAFHEAPSRGREQIIKEARRLLSPGGILAIVDIASDYVPSPNMLAGEPYVIEYQQNFAKQLRQIKGFLKPEYKILVPGHVGMWTLRRSPNAV